MSKLVGLHLWHCKLTATHADYIHRLLLGVLVENKHTQIISHTLQQLQYNAQRVHYSLHIHCNSHTRC